MNKDGNKTIEDFQILHDPITANFPEDAIVADFQGEDPDGDMVYYRLIEGEADNSAFRIKQGTTLVSAQPLFERKYLTEYTILVEAYDVYGGKKQKEFTITRGEGGDTKLPENITLSALAVDENIADHIIGELVAVGVEGYTFSLANENDEQYFYIEGQSLKTKVGLDYETQKEFSVRIKASAADGTQMKKDFPITVNDANDAPYDVLLTSDIALIDENTGALIGQIVAADQDPSDISFSFQLVDGEGDDDNSSFVVMNNKLLTARKFTQDDLGQKSIRIEVKDDEDAAYQKVLNISVQGELTENKAPRGIGVSNTTLWKEFAINDVVAHIFMSDPEGDEGTFTCSNEYFEIAGNTLKLIKKPEEGSDVDVEIIGSDGENEINVTFRFYTETNDTGLKSIHESTISVFPNPAINNLNFSALVDGEIFSLSGIKLKSFTLTDKVFIGDFAPGAYLLKVETREGVFSTKFIKK